MKNIIFLFLLVPSLCFAESTPLWKTLDPKAYEIIKKSDPNEIYNVKSNGLNRNGGFGKAEYRGPAPAGPSVAQKSAPADKSSITVSKSPDGSIRMSNY